MDRWRASTAGDLVSDQVHQPRMHGSPHAVDILAAEDLTGLFLLIDAGHGVAGRLSNQVCPRSRLLYLTEPAAGSPHLEAT